MVKNSLLTAEIDVDQTQARGSDLARSVIILVPRDYIRCVVELARQYLAYMLAGFVALAVHLLYFGAYIFSCFGVDL